MYIAIAGNIGSGKTTLTNLLSEHYGWIPKFEAVEVNPYMADYYQDIGRWSFNMEVFFLKERFKDMLKIAEMQRMHPEAVVVQDRSIYEGVYVFAENNFRSGTLSQKDFETYMLLFEQMQSVLTQPDLMIYLRADMSHLIDNIKHRGRDYEQSMQIDYLQNLNQLYEDFIFNKYKGDVLVIDKAKYDIKNPADLGLVYEAIDARVNGLFK